MLRAVHHDRDPNPLRCSIEIEVEPAEVFQEWTRYEQLPSRMEGVRRVKQIGERRILWDVDVFGHQVVWEAEVLESEPGKRIRWVSRWGASHAGRIDLERVPGVGTRLTLEIRYWPVGLLERLGARLGLLDARIERDLVRFKREIETLVASRAASGPAARPASRPASRPGGPSRATPRPSRASSGA